MRTIRIAALLAIVAAAPPATGQDAKDKDKLDPAKLLGTWEYVSGTKAGEEVAADRLQGSTVSFAKEEITLKNGDGSTFVIPYKVDASAAPAKLEMTIKESPFGADDTPTRGLLKLEGDRLTFGYIMHAAEYPKELKSTGDNMMHIFILKRAAK